MVSFLPRQRHGVVSARPDAQDGASGRPEGLGDVLDAERSNGASDVLWLDIEAQGQSGKVILFSKRSNRSLIKR